MLFRNPVGNGRENEPDDVVNAKRAFTRLGRYQPPSHGLHGIIDRGLDEAIKGFQEDNDLRVDGWMRPGGPTQRRLEESLGARWQTVADRRAERPRFRIDLPDWTPTLTDPQAGDDVLAPDGKPFTLSPLRTRELLEQAERFGRGHPREMRPSELDDLRRLREGLGLLWGSGMPQIEPPKRLPIPSLKPVPPIPVLKPRPEDEPNGDDSEATSFGRKLWDALDEFMNTPRNAPSDPPPLDPPSFPPPPAIPSRRPRVRFPRF